ncbi:hypothetical protein [Microbispora sp. NPDC046933]
MARILLTVRIGRPLISLQDTLDGLYDTYPSLLRPILSCFRSAFSALDA